MPSKDHEERAIERIVMNLEVPTASSTVSDIVSFCRFRRRGCGGNRLPCIAGFDDAWPAGN